VKKKPAKKRKRLVKGQDYDAWAIRYDDGTFDPNTRYQKPSNSIFRWVRVRFVEVKP